LVSDQTLDNLFGGYQAFNSNSTGTLNSAVGISALYSNTTGSANSAFGLSALYHNVSGQSNNAFGWGALFSNVNGWENSAFGQDALFFNTSGSDNSAFGEVALQSNTTGSENSAFGHFTMLKNTTGTYNSAFGYGALGSNTTGWGNSALGVGALGGVTTGNYNIGLGQQAGSSLDIGNYNIDIGNAGAAGEYNTIRIGTQGTVFGGLGQIATYIAGINGVTTGLAGAAVVVDANGQLGTISSSRRYKEDIRPMGEASDRLYQLRPVTFRYKTADAQGQKPLQFGLVAEEVAEAFPDLVVPGKDGQPQTVAYHVLPAMLLNELQKEHREVLAQQEQLVAQGRLIDDVNGKVAELAQLKQRVAELTALRAQIAELRGIATRLIAGQQGTPATAGIVPAALAPGR